MDRPPTDPRNKIRSEHLDRAAYVYVRQSSLKQVQMHKESQRLQYGLVDWTLDAGWPRDRIVVVDDDQGKTSTAPNVRAGFTRLVTAVGRGDVGIVIAWEVTRLARNSPDWHNLHPGYISWDKFAEIRQRISAGVMSKGRRVKDQRCCKVWRAVAAAAAPCY